jgi:hypothetical protein
VTQRFQGDQGVALAVEDLVHDTESTGPEAALDQESIGPAELSGAGTRQSGDLLTEVACAPRAAKKKDVALCYHVPSARGGSSAEIAPVAPAVVAAGLLIVGLSAALLLGEWTLSRLTPPLAAIVVYFHGAERPLPRGDQGQPASLHSRDDTAALGAEAPAR